MRVIKKAILVSIIISLSSCTKTNVLLTSSIDFEKYNSIHKDINIPSSNGQEFLIDDELLEENIINDTFIIYNGEITKKMLIEETDILYSQLKSNYGLYYYFEHEKFMTSRTKIINHIESSVSPPTTNELIALYRHVLSFIEDQHFKIEEEILHKQKDIYYSVDNYYYQNGTEFFSSESDNKMIENVIVDEQLYEPKEVLKDVITDDGKIRKQIVYMGDNLPKVSILYASGTSTSIPMIKHDFSVPPACSGYSKTYIKNVPVICLSRMDLDNNQIRSFNESAKMIGDSEYMIIDLRNNSGGNSLVFSDWMKLAFGNVGNRFLEVLRLGSYEEFYLDNENSKKLEDLGYELINENYYYLKPNTNRIKNDTYIIVLIGRNTISAAERYVEYLHSVNNVVFVGANTGGCFIGNQLYSLVTKYSNIKFVFGNSLKLFDNEHFREYEGFSPDIYYFGQANLAQLIVSNS